MNNAICWVCGNKNPTFVRAINQWVCSQRCFDAEQHRQQHPENYPNYAQPKKVKNKPNKKLLLLIKNNTT